jgi:hypothetical protein
LVSHPQEWNRLKAFENKELRSIFASKKEEVTAGSRTLLNEELHNSTKYCWGDQIKKVGMYKACSTHVRS